MNNLGAEAALDEVKTLIKLKRKEFDTKFELVFNVSQKTFENDEVLRDYKDHGLQFTKEALSNLMGGIGYYYGPLQIKGSGGGKKYDGKINKGFKLNIEPAGLFTGSPSRSRFPRGFLWDEGFHLMLTC